MRLWAMQFGPVRRVRLWLQCGAIVQVATLAVPWCSTPVVAGHAVIHDGQIPRTGHGLVEQTRMAARAFEFKSLRVQDMVEVVATLGDGIIESHVTFFVTVQTHFRIGQQVIAGGVRLFDPGMAVDAGEALFLDVVLMREGGLRQHTPDGQRQQRKDDEGNTAHDHERNLQEARSKSRKSES